MKARADDRMVLVTLDAGEYVGLGMTYRNALIALLAMSCLEIAASGCSALGSGCDTSNDSNTPVTYEDGQVQGGEFMSSPWTGPLLPFPSGRRYDIKHHLGCIPRQISCWVAFSSTGTGQSSLAPASGNLCVLQAVNDTYVEVKNDTCSDMYVLIAASCGPGATSTSSPDGGQNGAKP